MTTESNRRLELMPLRDIAGAEKNPKKHAHVDIEVSIERFGYVEPVVLDERTNRLVAGHGRIEALRAARKKGESPPQGVELRDGEWLIPVIRGWHSRSDDEAQAYLVASNQLTAKGGWDDSGLAEMLKGLEKNAALDGTGFASDDVTALIDSLADAKETKKPGRVNDVANVFQVLVEVNGEVAQAELIEKLERDGFRCRPLVF